MAVRPLRIEIYSRPGCHLCDEAKDVITRVLARVPKVQVDVVETNIDRNAMLRDKYGSDIPVVLLEGNEVFRHRVNESDLERKLTQQWNTSTS